MKRRLLIVFLILAFALSLTFAACEPEEQPPVIPSERPVADKTVTQTKLVTYDGPSVMTSSAEAKVRVEDKELFVYDTRVNHNRSFSWSAKFDVNQAVVFDFEGRVRVEITIPSATSLHNVVVRPLDMDVKPTVQGNVISFTLDYTGNYAVEYGLTETDVASNNVVHVFANPIETDAIDPDNVPDKTVYVGPGVYMASALPVTEDGTTVYLAGGAVVYGQIRTGNVKNLTIRGRGILAGGIYNRGKDSEFTLPIELQNCKDVTIKDITILDPAGWAVTLYRCENVAIDNLKIITARPNGDGISVQSCTNVTVKGGFVRSWDDSLVVKNVDNYSTSKITFDGVCVWTDLAQSMEVGYETYGATMTDITFKNITVLHNFHKAAMSIHNADQAQISNVTYENVTIEDARMLGDNQNDGENDFLIDMTIAYNTEWTHSGGDRGTIKNVKFNNIKVLQMADTIRCRAFGEGVNSNVDGVVISNVEIAGRKITSLDELKMNPGVFVTDMRYVAGEGAVSGSLSALPYKLALSDNDQAQITSKQSVSQQGLEVPDFALVNVAPTYAGRLIGLQDVEIRATYGNGDRLTAPWELGEITQPTGHEVSKLFDGNRATEWTYGDWQGLENEFVAITFTFPEKTRVGAIRILGSELSNIVKSYNISIVSLTSRGRWTYERDVGDITVNPQTSNYSDIILGANDGFTCLQIRFFRKSDITHPDEISLGEIEFYPPSLTTGKAFKEIAEHEDVYNIENTVDGNPLSYFESKKGVFPAAFAIDMGANENVKYINIHLPPLLLWETRTQEIEILGSLDGVTYQTVVAKTAYVFNAAEGNMASIVLDQAVEMRYIKFVYYSNSTEYGAQISELYVYGE